MDKIDRLFDVMEHPECFNTGDIEEILRDPEVNDVFMLLDKTKSSLQNIPTPDVAKEWEDFNSRHLNTAAPRRIILTYLFSHKIASSIAICIASIAAVAAIVDIGVRYIKHHESDYATDAPEVEANIILSQPDSIRNSDEKEELLPETIIFDNEPFEDVITEISGYYGYTVEFACDTSKSLRLYFRWNPSLTIEDVVESLSTFEQITLTIKDKIIKID